jgi:hypothetical protein
MAFAEWLQRYKLDDMDKGNRARLFEVMDNLPMIEQWRQTLPSNLRLALNHPNAVLRRFVRDSVVELNEENTALKAHIAELEAARTATATEPTTATPSDSTDTAPLQYAQGPPGPKIDPSFKSTNPRPPAHGCYRQCAACECSVADVAMQKPSVSCSLATCSTMLEGHANTDAER